MELLEQHYVIGWTEISDEDWDGLMWEGGREASLSSAIRRAEGIARLNPKWNIIVYDENENADEPLVFMSCDNPVSHPNR
jgi:hypothetical protein